MKEKINALGWLGAFCILIAYMYLTFELLEAQSFDYNAFNLIGGICIAIRVYYDKNHSSFVLELVFIAAALIAIIKSLINS